MKQLTIVKYPWHTGHDYELLKLPHQFLFLTSTYRQWAHSQRPLPRGLRWISELEQEKSDVMILHLDQWSYQEPAKRTLYLRLRDRYAGPKITIIHGSNFVDGCSNERMRELTAGCLVVCNSETARIKWELPDSHFILHGFDEAEWRQTDYSRGNIVVAVPSHSRHQRCRNQPLIDRVRSRLAIDWLGENIRCSSFDKYREFLSTSSIFFNPSHASANPRARAEAMLSGLAVVTTASHGERSYIKNGENGFASDDESELCEYLEYLQHHPEKTRELGENGRTTAAQLFSKERYQREWNELLTEAAELGAS